MPVILADALPAAHQLRAEGVAVVSPRAAGAAVLRLAFVNLMPDKPTTELQISRMLAMSRHQVEPVFIYPGSHRPRTVSAEHLLAYYQPWDAVRGTVFDGMLITGTPIERLAFEAVNYWHEVQAMLATVKWHWGRLFALCWGAQAALYDYYGIPKHILPQKRFGLYPHHLASELSPLASGFPSHLPVPVSRHSATRIETLVDWPHLDVVLRGDDDDVCLIEDRLLGHVYMLNHLEYDADTLAQEYYRDQSRSDHRIDLPQHYFVDGDINRVPDIGLWRPAGIALFTNWLDRLAQALRRSEGNQLTRSI